MNILKITILFLLVFYFESFGQIRPGAKQISLSHSDVALAFDSYALFNNPAGLAQQNWREFGVYYSPSPFGLSKLANGAAVLHQPTNYGSFAVAYTNYGFDLYMENSFFVSYSKNIVQRFFVGATLKYTHLSIKNYGSDSSFSLLIGGLALITNNLRLGFAIDNISRSSFGKEDNQIPIIYDFGLTYILLSKLIFNAAIEKEIDRNPSLRFGIDYQIIEYFNIRIGTMTEPSSFSAGVGINYSIFEIDYGVFNHQDLGLTHQLGVTLQFGGGNTRLKRIQKYLTER